MGPWAHTLLFLGNTLPKTSVISRSRKQFHNRDQARSIIDNRSHLSFIHRPCQMPSKKESDVHPGPYLLEILAYKSKAGNSIKLISLWCTFLTSFCYFFIDYIIVTWSGNFKRYIYGYLSEKVSLYLYKIFKIQKGRTFSFNDILRLCTIVINIAIRSRT